MGFIKTLIKSYKTLQNKDNFSHFAKSDEIRSQIIKNELQKVINKFFSKIDYRSSKKNKIFPKYEKNPRVSVIAVNYNSINDINDFIESIRNQTYHNFEIIIVDNNSADKSLSRIISKTKKKFCSIQIIKNKKNVGFSEACNIGSRVAKNDLIALINIDTKLDKNWLKSLVSKISLEDVAAVTSKTLFFDDFITIKISSDKDFSINEKQLLNQFTYKKYFINNGLLNANTIQSVNNEIVLSIPRIKKLSITFSESLNSIDILYKNDNSNNFHILKTKYSNSSLVINLPSKLFKPLINNAGSNINRLGDPYDIGYAEYDEIKFGTKKYVGAFCGCSVLLDKRYFIERELFVGELFAYYEDSELSKYLINKGYKIFYNPSSVVFHKHSTSLGERSLFREYLIKRNYYIFKNYDEVSLKYLSSLRTNYNKYIPKELKRVISFFDKKLARRSQAHGTIYKKLKNFAVYNSYWSTYGGGEKHALTTSLILTKYKNYDNYYLISEKSFSKEKLENRFALELKQFKQIYFDFVTSDLTKKFFTFINSTYLSNLISKAKNSLYIVSFPQKNVSEKFITSYIFLINSWLSLNAINKFWHSKKRIKKYLWLPIFGIKKQFTLKKKNKIRNFVQIGRFQNKSGHLKRQDISIKAFNKLGNCKSNLILIGANLSSSNHIKELQKLRNNNKRINFYFGIKYNKLSSYLNESFFYISAAGYDVDENKNPENLEHFGITILEAMTAGCIPIVYSKGGPADIIKKTGVGFLFNTINELSLIMSNLLSFTNEELYIISKKSKRAALKFINDEIKKNHTIANRKLIKE